jgi:hypothetical protein
MFVCAPVTGLKKKNIVTCLKINLVICTVQ